MAILLPGCILLPGLLLKTALLIARAAVRAVQPCAFVAAAFPVPAGFPVVALADPGRECARRQFLDCGIAGFRVLLQFSQHVGDGFADALVAQRVDRGLDGIGGGSWVRRNVSQT